MSAILVQSQSQDNSSLSTGGTLAYGSNVTVGNTLIFILPFYNSFNPVITDSQGNTWTRTIGPTFNGGYKTFIFTAVAGSSGANTLTLTAVAGGNNLGSTLLEVSGLAASPLDQITTAVINTSSPCNAGSITPTVNGEYVACFFTRQGVFNSYSNGTLTTIRSQSPSNNTCCLADYIQPTAGTITPDVVCSASVSYPVTGVAVSFKPSAVAPSTPSANMMRMGMGF